MSSRSQRDQCVVLEVSALTAIPVVNGVKAKGGSIDGPGAVVVDGMVFINSGYSRAGGLPGNVLLALAP